MAKVRARPERLELRLTRDEKKMIEFAARTTGQSSRDFVVKATIKELKRLKITPTREQADLFTKEPGKQCELF